MAEHLRRCVASIKPYADRIVVVEGRFGHHWKHRPEFDTPHSIDGTAEVARELGCEVIEVEGYWQNEQRDFYLVGKEGDVYFIIDADMTLEGTLNKEEMLHGDADVWAMWSVDPDGKRFLSPIWVHRHIGVKPHHAPGNILVDGYGRLMDGTYPNGVTLTDCWLKHWNMREGTNNERLPIPKQ